MKVLGLTGGIATGKTNVSNLFKKWGIGVVDADQISKQLTQPKGEALPQIAEAFGQKVFFEDGTLNRAALGEWVFSNPAEKQKLEGILHPLITQQIKTELEYYRRKGDRVVVLDVPLLFETGMEHMADEVWLTDAPQREQIARLQKRNGLTKAQALARIKSQWPNEKKQALANEVIDTTGTKKETAAYVKALFSKRFYPLSQEGKDD